MAAAAALRRPRRAIRAPRATGEARGAHIFRITRMAKKLKLQESRVVISSERGLAAHRRLRFFERSVVPIVDRRANGGRRMEWARILAYITGTVDQELLLRNEYLAAENRILRGQLKGRLKFSDAERAKLGEIGRRLGRKALG